MANANPNTAGLRRANELKKRRRQERRLAEAEALRAGGVLGSVRVGSGRSAVLPAVSDRGPPELTTAEGDFVHAVGLMNSAYSFAVRSFVVALEAWRDRELIPWREAAARLGLNPAQVHRVRAGEYRPSHATMLRLRALMCGDQEPSSHDLELNRHHHRV